MKGLVFDEIKTRFCELDDFDQDGNNDKSKFYQTADYSVADIDTYGVGLKCPVNASDLSIQGKYDASAAKNLMVIVQKCNPETSEVTCKSDAEIEEWLRYKFILIVRNQRKFIQYQFGEKRVQKAAELKWYSVNNVMRSDNPMVIYRSDIYLDDNQFSLGSFMSDEERGFQMKDNPTRIMEYPNDFYNAITFEMSFTHRMYNRHVYNSLDLLADLGGLFSALRVPFAAVLLLLNYFNSY